jgi:hypothetical protein
MSHTPQGRFTIERPLYRYVKETVPERVSGSYTIPAHETERQVEDGAERVTVDVTMDLDAICSQISHMAAHTKRGHSILLGGLVTGRVVSRERIR